MIAAGDVDYIDPGAAYYQFTYMVTSAAQRALLSWQPDDVANPTPDLADGRADDLERQQDAHLQDQAGDQVQPAARRRAGGDPRRHLGRRQVRDRAWPPAGCRQRLRRDLLRRPRGLQAGPGGGQEGPDDRPGHQRHPDARRPDDRLQARQTRCAAGRAGAVAADQRSGAGGVREAVRRREPLQLRRAPARQRALLRHQLRARQEHHAGAEPELGSEHRLASRLPGQDRHPGGLHGHGVGRQEDPHRERSGERRLQRRATDVEAGRHQVPRPARSVRRRAATATWR